MGHGAFHFHFCLLRQPILCLWLCATYRPTDYPRYMTKNCWHSVDAHFHNGAGSVSLSVFPIKAANTSFMTICNLLLPRLPKYMTKNRWRSIDAHFHDGAGSISLSLLPIKAANTSFITSCNLSPPRLPKIHDQELLTLCWRSFCHGCIHNMQSFDLA